MVTRAKTMELHQTGPENYRLIGRLTDTSRCGDYGGHSDDGDHPTEQVIHDFVVDGELMGSDLVIIRLDVSAETHPYRQCPAILPGCQELVGKSLARGWRQTVLATLGATAGCTHVTTLLIGLAEARTMAFFLQMNAKVAYSEPTREDGRWTAAGLELVPTIVGACHVLTSNGPVVQGAVDAAARAADADN
jgi:hypothetical protein